MKGEKKHILIIDDEEGIREPLKEYLETENFFVTTAKDSQDAKNKIQILEFDLLIVDIMMPGQSGLELTKEIRKNKDTPIIFVGGVAEIAGMLALAKTNPKWLGFAMEGYIFAAIIFWIICYAMSKYSYNLEQKYKTER